MKLCSRGVTISRIVACAAAAIMVATAWPARAADDVPPDRGISLPSVDVDVDVNVDVGDIDISSRPQRRSGAYAPIPSARSERIIERPMVPPHQIAAMLRAGGFSLLGRINRRGWVYTVAVLDRYGDDGRVIIDARTGAMIRFIPALAINGSLDGGAAMIYGPPRPPPLAPELRSAPRPPVAVAPRLASRTPASGRAVVPRPRPRPTASASIPPRQASHAGKAGAVAPRQSAAIQARSERAAAPQVPAVEPDQVELKPTQQMPPVQTLE